MRLFMQDNDNDPLPFLFFTSRPDRFVVYSQHALPGRESAPYKLLDVWMDSRIILKRIIQPRIVTPRRADDQALEVHVNGGSSQAKGESFAEMVSCLGAEEGEAVEFRV